MTNLRVGNKNNMTGASSETGTFSSLSKCTLLFVIIILTCVIAVYGHECKEFKLSAADQSVIDMMKHYLHTSRKTECSDNKLSNIFK
jgi:hypothetical protein